MTDDKMMDTSDWPPHLAERAPWETTATYPRHGAVLTQDELYRYVLTRWFDDLNFNTGEPNDLQRHLPIIMHNGSTANALENDHTITKCCGFATRLGFGGIVVGNLYGARSTDPKALFDMADPVGIDNDLWIARIFATIPTGGTVICAWGALKGPKKDERIATIVEMANGAGVVLKALRVTNGTPHHPLRLPYDAKPVAWSPAA